MALSFPSLLVPAASGVLALVNGDTAVSDRRAGEPTSRPNIVLIVCDDAEVGDTGFSGGADAVTPHLDALAERGVRFRQAYVCTAACSPSRAGLLTGIHPSRFGHDFNISKELEQGPDGNEVGLPLDQTTLAAALRPLGYRTAIVGKWHLGVADHFHPQERGFDEFVGFLHGASRYRGGIEVMRGRSRENGWEGHLSEFLGRTACRFIRENASGRFFLYLCFKAPHSPQGASEEDLAALQNVPDERRRDYLGLMRGMDRAVGEVLRTLDECSIREDTLVVFLSDNGATTTGAGSNGDLRGGKGSFFEGGIRVPFLVSWPARLPAGSTFEHVVSSLDVFPTALAAAGGTPPVHLDGVDLTPYLTATTEGEPHPSLCWRTGQSSAIRAGDWKLILDTGAPVALFDLGSDPGERRNRVRDQETEQVVRRMGEQFALWDMRRELPTWPRETGRR